MRTILVIAATLLLAGCGSTAAGGGTKVVAGFYPLAWAAEQVGGTAVAVENLTPAGTEPHDVELTPQQVGAVQSAGVVVYLSHGFQPAVEQAAAAARGTKVDALAGLPLQPGNPHVWLDPVLFARVVERIGAALHRPTRGAALAARVRALDGLYRRGLADCRQRTFVATHAAFGYLAARYGLHQLAITGVDPEAEPNPHALATLVAVVRRDRLRTVFFERLVSPRLAQTVARASGARTAVLDPIEGLTPQEAAAGTTYLTLMRQNLAELRKALGCR